MNKLMIWVFFVHRYKSISILKCGHENDFNVKYYIKPIFFVSKQNMNENKTTTLTYPKWQPPYYFASPPSTH